MKRADKIRLAEQARSSEAQSDTRDAKDREAARTEWGQVRKAAREAYLAGADWKSILDRYETTEGFYSAQERRRMCHAYTDELIRMALR